MQEVYFFAFMPIAKPHGRHGPYETIAKVFGLRATDNNSTQRRKDAKIKTGSRIGFTGIVNDSNDITI